MWKGSVSKAIRLNLDLLLAKECITLLAPPWGCLSSSVLIPFVLLLRRTATCDQLYVGQPHAISLGSLLRSCHHLTSGSLISVSVVLIPSRCESLVLWLVFCSGELLALAPLWENSLVCHRQSSFPTLPTASYKQNVLVQYVSWIIQ